MNTHDEKPLITRHEDVSSPDITGSDKISLDEWLSWIEKQHVTAIDLGLERAAGVYQLLIKGIAAKNKKNKKNISSANSVNSSSANNCSEKLAKKIITVAGTNGKGTTIAALESLFLSANLRVATYTSPHILKFNERVKLNGKAISDDALCDAFVHVRSAQLKSPHSLSFFEFTTLAAFYIFSQQPLDVLLLEVGLGGRLDAVNIVDPDVAIITSIALDHQEWLGNNLEAIAFEKAGILRNNIDFVCGQSSVNKYLKSLAQEKNCQSYIYSEEFELEIFQDQLSSNATFIWRGQQPISKKIINHNLKALQLPHNSIACALQAFYLVKGSLEFDFTSEQTNLALHQAQLAGRYQKLENANDVPIIIDVAHNPAAVHLLKQRLSEDYPEYAISAIFSVLNDKDVAGIVDIMSDIVAHWYIAQIQHPRAQQLSYLTQSMLDVLELKQDSGLSIKDAKEIADLDPNITSFDSLVSAAEQAFLDTKAAIDLSAVTHTNKKHLLVAFGSFHVVEELLNSHIF